MPTSFSLLAKLYNLLHCSQDRPARQLSTNLYDIEGNCCRVVWNDNYSTPTITIFIERNSCTVSWEAERGSVVRIGRCHWAFPTGVVPGPRGIVARQSGVVLPSWYVSLDVVSVECLNQGTNERMKLDLEGGLILSQTQLVCLLCRWIAWVAGLTSRRALLNKSR